MGPEDVMHIRHYVLFFLFMGLMINHEKITVAQSVTEINVATLNKTVAWN